MENKNRNTRQAESVSSAPKNPESTRTASNLPRHEKYHRYFDACVLHGTNVRRTGEAILMTSLAQTVTSRHYFKRANSKKGCLRLDPSSIRDHAPRVHRARSAPAQHSASVAPTHTVHPRDPKLMRRMDYSPNRQ